MVPLPATDQRHPWLRYQIEEYTEEIRRSYEQRLKTIWSRLVNRVHVLNFKGLTAEMRQDLAVRLRMHGPWTANVPHLLAHYLFRYAKGRKSGARLSGGHFIGRLAMHFGLVSNEGLRGLQAWVAQGPERQQAATSGAPEANEAGQAAKKVAPEIPAPAPAPAHAPLPPPPASQPHTMP
ncbi:hypothetical protein Tco_1378931 [Tanacetum coccineum]